MITYKSLADDIKALFLTRNDSFGLKKNDELDLIVDTASSYKIMDEKSENMFKKFFRYATRTVSTSDKSDSGFVLIDARCNPDLIEELNVVDPRGNEATCEDIYYNGYTYLIHSMNYKYKNRDKDEMKLYLTHLYEYIIMVVNSVMNKPSCGRINEDGAAAYILKYILDDTNFLDYLKEEGYEFIDILRGDPAPAGAAFPMLYHYGDGVGYPNPLYIAAKYKKVAEDHKLMQTDYITILLDRCQILTVWLSNKEILDTRDKRYDALMESSKQSFLNSLMEGEIAKHPVSEAEPKLAEDALDQSTISSNKTKECMEDVTEKDEEKPSRPKNNYPGYKAESYRAQQNKNNYKKNFSQNKNHRPGNR